MLIPLLAIDFIALSQTDWSGSNSVRRPPQLFIPPAKLNERCIKHAQIFSPVSDVGVFNVCVAGVRLAGVRDVIVLGTKPAAAAADNCLMKSRLFVIVLQFARVLLFYYIFEKM
jgi:hypothetical protein